MTCVVRGVLWRCRRLPTNLSFRLTGCSPSKRYARAITFATRRPEFPFASIRYSHKPGGMWPTTQYMGLVSDAAQLVRTRAGTWTFISRVGVQRAEQCDSIHALVLDSAKTVTVGRGVVCCAHAPHDVY